MKDATKSRFLRIKFNPANEKTLVIYSIFTFLLKSIVKKDAFQNPSFKIGSSAKNKDMKIKRAKKASRLIPLP